MFKLQPKKTASHYLFTRNSHLLFSLAVKLSVTRRGVITLIYDWTVAQTACLAQFCLESTVPFTLHFVVGITM